MGLQTLSMGETLYYTIGQPYESIKKSKKMHISMPCLKFQGHLLTTKDPSFKI
jgi:hypothetical protein